MKKLKIAFVEPVGAHGGLEVYDLGACSALVGNNCDVELYTSEKTSDLIGLKGFSIYRYFGRMYDARLSLIRRFVIFLRGLVKVKLRLGVFNPDLIYIHVFTFSFQELCVLFMMLIHPSKLFVNVHDPITFGSSSKRLIKYLFSKLLLCSKVTVTTHTEYSKSVMKEIFPRVEVTVIPYSDVDFINSAKGGVLECKNSLNLSADFKYVLFFGQIKKTKGLELLIHAWKTVALEIPDVKLLIVGRCWHDEADFYRSLIDSMELSSRVVWVEKYIDDKDVPSYFKASELVVLPYTRIYSSAVLIRAIGYKTPFIVSDQSAFIEVVGSAQSNAVFKSGDAEDLARKLLVALSDDEVLSQMTKDAAKIIEGRFSWDFVGREMKSVFTLRSGES